MRTLFIPTSPSRAILVGQPYRSLRRLRIHAHDAGAKIVGGLTAWFIAVSGTRLTAFVLYTDMFCIGGCGQENSGFRPAEFSFDMHVA
jgi:hypothetical protein